MVLRLYRLILLFLFQFLESWKPWDENDRATRRKGPGSVRLCSCLYCCSEERHLRRYTHLEQKRTPRYRAVLRRRELSAATATPAASPSLLGCQLFHLLSHSD